MKVLLTILSSIISILLKGLVLKLMWGWFIASTFNIPELTFLIALGISFLIERLINHTEFITTTKIKTTEDILYQSIFNIIYSLFVLVGGWIVTLFI